MRRRRVYLRLEWTPSLLWLGGLGLLIGLVLAALLGRLGWRLLRTPS